MLFLRMPQPGPMGDGIMAELAWTEDEPRKFVENGTLPRDLASIEQDGKVVVIWLCDASKTNGLLPEVELEFRPDFKKQPALCIFDMGKDEAALMPSEFLRMVPKEGRKVQFVLADSMEAKQFGGGKVG